LTGLEGLDFGFAGALQLTGVLTLASVAVVARDALVACAGDAAKRD
jgi:hypothetical protein